MELTNDQIAKLVYNAEFLAIIAVVLYVILFGLYVFYRYQTR